MYRYFRIAKGACNSRNGARLFSVLLNKQLFVKTGHVIAPGLFVVSLVVFLYGCSSEQIERSVHNAVRGELCVESDKDRGSEIGLEPCGGSYARYKAARAKELGRQSPSPVGVDPRVHAENDSRENTGIEPQRAAEASSEQINGCWVHQTQQSKGRSNKLTLCTYDVTAHLTVEFPNALSEYAPTTCRQSGMSRPLQNHAVLIALNGGRCKNGNSSPALDYECELKQDKLMCEDRTYGKSLEFTRRSSE